MEDGLYMLKSCGQDNYLILKVGVEDIPLFELECLGRRKIKGLLVPEITLQNGNLELWYKLTGCQSLRTLLEVKRFGKSEWITFLKGVCDFSGEIERHLLNPLGILVDFDSVFYNSDRKQFLFCYYPQGKAPLKEGLLRIVEELLTLVDYKDNEMVSLLYQAYEILNQPNVSYKSLVSLGDKRQTDTIEKFFDCETKGEEENTESEDVLWEGCTDKVIEQEESFLRTKFISKNFWIEEIPKWWKNKLAMLRKETKKRVKPYLDFRPVIIKPEEEKLETPTVLLAEASTMREAGKVTFCLKPSEDDGGDCIPLTKERILIGKNKESADGVIDDVTVSRLHAFITKDEDNYYLEDLNSLNGTFLNGDRLAYREKVNLRENDIVGIGGKNYCFCPL